MLLRSLFLVVIAFLASCSPKPYDKARKIQEEKVKEVITKIDMHQAPELFDTSGTALKTSFIPTVNFGSRKPDFVIIHHTAQDSIQQTIKTFTLEHTQASAHYIVGRNGEVVQMLSDDLRAWHAGASKWGNNYDMNSCSIGIELDNNGVEPFSESQINSLLILLQKLKTTYNIPNANFIGHGDVAPKRKVDPSILFPWKKLADAGFGLWYNVPNLMPPANFDIENALRRIGYDTRDLPAAIVAFKRHFVQLDLNPVMNDWDKCVLYNLYWKY
ncbi:N-acetylmuramoyl-L-alanine amidase [Pedobacter arcticus]|uniref:N-acetylmuramoyl-L-alanine amidase n=1 Tax=Pedobacter arcticus TaxID=752140 RepID=UPI0002F73C36|nr:N-acetylmuramoyl-L-alanine amidase [Pedobacter arcticus]